MSKQPWLKFYPTDWRADPALRMCSLAARGLWIEMLGLMHEADPYGHLLVNGQTVTDTQLGALVGAPPDQIAALLGDLEAAGVFSRTRAGVIYSRKLSRMKKKAAAARNNGRKGGNPNLSKEKENSASVNPPDKGRDKPQRPEARDQSYITPFTPLSESDPKPPDKRAPRAASGASATTNLPEDWSPDIESARALMAELGLTRDEMNFCYHQMKDHAHAKGRKLKDWDAGYRQWVRKAKRDGDIGAGSRGRKAAGGRSSAIWDA